MLGFLGFLYGVQECDIRLVRGFYWVAMCSVDEPNKSYHKGDL